MKRTKIQTGLLITYFTLLLFYSISCYSLADSKTISETVTIDPIDAHVVSLKIYDADTLYISGDVTSGTIDLGIFDSENYPNPTYYEEYYYDLTSTFTREFEPLYTDTFYLEFYNPSTTNSATISYTLEHDTTYMTNLIINISVAAAFLALVLILNFTGKK